LLKTFPYLYRIRPRLFSYHIHMLHTLFLTFRMRVFLMPIFGSLLAIFDGLGSSFLS
jgi:hypothetical protein